MTRTGLDHPRTASVVIIGGGVMGVSTAYHLAAAGVQDVVLLDRDTFGSGSTCKAAGGVRAQFSDRINVELGARSLRAFETFHEQFGQEKNLGRSHPDVWILPPTGTLSELDPYNFRLCTAAAFGQIGLGQPPPDIIKKQYEAQKLAVPNVCPGSADTPTGRKDAYCSLIAPFDSPSVAAGFTTASANNGASSCGIFIRGMWQLLGAGFMGPTQPSTLPPHKNDQGAMVPTTRDSDNLHFYSDYTPNQIMEDIGGLADTWGARMNSATLDGSGNHPFAMGDVLYITWDTGHHIFSICSIGDKYSAADGTPKWDLYSTDGGVSFYGGDNDCQALGARIHTLAPGDDGGLTVTQKVSKEKVAAVKIKWWVNLAMMQGSFTLPWIYPYTP